MPARTYTKEADVKAEVKKLLSQYGWFWWMPPANGFGKAGVSDFNALKEGHFMGLETKFKRNTPTPAQVKYLRQVHDNGGIGIVVNEKTLENLEWLLLVFDDGSYPRLSLHLAAPVKDMMDY